MLSSVSFNFFLFFIFLASVSFFICLHWSVLCSIPKGCALQISGVLSLCTLSSGTVSFQPSSLGLLRLSAPSHKLSKSARLCLGGDSLCYGLEAKAVNWEIVWFFVSPKGHCPLLPNVQYLENHCFILGVWILDFIGWFFLLFQVQE